MRIFDNVETWVSHRRSLANTVTIGFVPTMGNLHAGHLSLFTESKKENDITVSSLFINPMQFNNRQDFENYPRTLDTDLALLEEAGIEYCILPTQEGMYKDDYRYQVSETLLSELMEGKHRPGHFQGVLTVVMKLLNLVQPTTAYFGEKDYQQFLLIRDMAKAFFMPFHIKPCPTVREPSGLAYSSRNNRLTPQQYALAQIFAGIFLQNKPCDVLAQELKTAGITVDYLVDYQGRRYVAVLIGDIRLIDNYPILQI